MANASNTETEHEVKAGLERRVERHEVNPKDERKQRRHSDKGTVKAEGTSYEYERRGSGLNLPAREKRRMKRQVSEPLYQTKHSETDKNVDNWTNVNRLMRTCPLVNAHSDEEKQRTRRRSVGNIRHTEECSETKENDKLSSFHLSSDFISSEVQTHSDALEQTCDVCDISDLTCGYCQDCKQRLCKQCCVGHRKINTTKAHTLIFTGNDDIISNKDKTGDKTHVRKSETVGKSGLRTNSRQLLKRLTTMRSQILEHVVTLESECNAALSDIQELRNTVVHHIDRLMISASDDTKQKHKRISENLSSENKKIETYIEELMILCKEFDASRLGGKPPTQLAEVVNQAAERYEKIHTEATEICLSFTKLGITFRPNPILLPLTKTINSLGEVDLERYVDNTASEIKVKEFSSWCNGDEMTQTCITGMVCFKDGRLILADQSNRVIKLFDPDFKPLSRAELIVPPWDLALIAESKVLVTLPDLKQCCQFRIEDTDLKKEIAIETESECLGITDIMNEIIISSYDGEAGELTAISKHGGISRKSSVFYMHDHQFKKNIILKRPNYLQKSKDSKVLYVSDIDIGLIGISVSDLCTVLFLYEHTNLRGTIGVDVDSAGYIYVCGIYSHNIHQLTETGILCRTLSTKSLTPFPQCVCFSRHDNALIVSLDKQYDLKVLQFS